MIVMVLFLVIVFLLAMFKKVPLYDSFADGTKQAIKLTVSILPYLAAIFVALELMRASGLSKNIGNIVQPLFTILGIPTELTELLILRALSGSGSLAVLENIFKDYGVDSYVSRAASVVMASNDTIMYIAACYLSTAKDKRSGGAIPISLLSSIIGAVCACIICRYL